MNKLTGTITQIQNSGAIVLVDVEVNGQQFSALLIESTNPPKWLERGSVVGLVFKETEVSLAKNLSGQISSRNRMMCIVENVLRGQLLSNVTLQFQDTKITSAITTRSLDGLNIKVGDEIEALVKSNEVSLMQTV